MIKLETDRLILRDYEKSDFDAYFRLKTDDETMYYMQDIRLNSIDDAKAEGRICRCACRYGES